MLRGQAVSILLSVPRCAEGPTEGVKMHSMGKADRSKGNSQANLKVEHTNDSTTGLACHGKLQLLACVHFDNGPDCELEQSHTVGFKDAENGFSNLI